MPMLVAIVVALAIRNRLGKQGPGHRPQFTRLDNQSTHEVAMFFEELRRSLTILLLTTLPAIPSVIHSQTLTHQPFAGAVTSTSARFCVRVEGASSANIRVSTSNDFQTSIVGEPESPDASTDYFALIEVEGLRPDQIYYYQALLNGEPRGEVRRFQTFPEPGERIPFRFTFGSCTVLRRAASPEDGRVFSVMAKDDPRFLLQIGDWGYPDTTDSRKDSLRVFSASMARMQETYRGRYDSAYAIQQVLRIAPIDYMFDDHDFMNDDASATSYPRLDSMQQVEVGNVPRENVLQAYRQLFPGYPQANPNGGAWHRFTCGNADFFVIDTRSQRSPNLEAFVRNPASDSIEFVPGAQHSMLAGESGLAGENQRDWLMRELKQSTADWKFIVSTVPFNRALRQVLDFSVSLQDSMVLLPALGRISILRVALELSDKWVGFPADQEALLDFIRENSIKNVIVLSGDLHTAAIDDGANGGLPEIMAGALDQANSKIVLLLQIFGYNIWNGGGQNRSFNDAYGRVTVFGADSLHLEIVDEFGSLIAHKTLFNEDLPSSVRSESNVPPAEFRIENSFPNPLRPDVSPAGTTIQYELPENSFVEIHLFDLAGRQVRRYEAVWQLAGDHSLRWDGRDELREPATSGIYLVRIGVTNQKGEMHWASQKIALLR